MRKTMFIVALLAATTAADAQPAFDYSEDGRWVRRAVGKKCYTNTFTGARSCEYDWGPYRRVEPHYHTHHTPRAYYPAPVYGYTHRQHDASQGPRCHNGKISAIGIEAFDKDKAKEQAQAAWAETVRAQVAGKFMDAANAEAATYECWRSATGNRASEKLADFGGRELHQCQLTGIPCRSKIEIADTGDPATEAAIRQLENRGYDVRLTEPRDADAPKKPRLLRRLLKRD